MSKEEVVTIMAPTQTSELQTWHRRCWSSDNMKIVKWRIWCSLNTVNSKTIVVKFMENRYSEYVIVYKNSCFTKYFPSKDIQCRYSKLRETLQQVIYKMAFTLQKLEWNNILHHLIFQLGNARDVMSETCREWKSVVC